MPNNHLPHAAKQTENKALSSMSLEALGDHREWVEMTPASPPLLLLSPLTAPSRESNWGLWGHLAWTFQSPNYPGHRGKVEQLRSLRAVPYVGRELPLRRGDGKLLEASINKDATLIPSLKVWLKKTPKQCMFSKFALVRRVTDAASHSFPCCLCVPFVIH